MNRALLWLVCSLVLAVPGFGQNCDLPLPPAKEAIIFSPQQEEQAGAVISEQVEVETEVVGDQELLANLRRIGDRLAQSLPAGSLKPQWFIIESPAVNAFTSPGGRIYVTRKLIAFTQSEEELAGVLAHELGHVVTREPAVQLSRLWTTVLKKNSPGSAAEIESDYHRILDLYRTNPRALKVRPENDLDAGQRTADQIAAYLLARADYSPSSLGTFWDRYAQTNHNAGSWLSDFFGTIPPDSKRLRLMEKDAASVPPACVNHAAKESSADFAAWRDKVIAYDYARSESVHGVVWRKHLSPGLEGEVTHLLFSPNGQYVLAQTASTIFVLTRQPLAYLFQISASEAHDASFTPDSRQVAFYDSGLRVERWDIASQKRVSVHELYVREGCFDSALSPDGNLLACVTSTPGTLFPLQLLVLDVDTGSATYTKRNFFAPVVETPFSLEWILNGLLMLERRTPYVQLRFSTDGRYLVAARGTSQLALDVSHGFAPVKMAGAVQSLLYRDFGFIGPDRLIGLRGESGPQSAVVRFPTGEKIRDVVLGRQHLDGATRGHYVMLRPVTGYAVGLMDLSSGKIVQASRFAGMDAFDDTLVFSLANGDVALAKIGENKPSAMLHLPEASLGYIRAASLSPDFSMVAMSQKDRGGVWDLKSGERIFHVRGFRGAWFRDSSTVYALFPPMTDADDSKETAANKDAPKQDPTLTDFSDALLDVRTRHATLAQDLGNDSRIVEAGEYLLDVHRVDKQKPDKGVVLEVRDVSSPAVLWSRQMRETPGISPDPQGGNAALLWNIDSDAAREILKSDAALRQRVAATQKSGGFLIEIVDVKTGAVRSRFGVEAANSWFRPLTVYVTANRVVVMDSEHRVLLFSLDGEAKGHVFGDYATASADGQLLCVEEKPGVLTVLDGDTLNKRDEFTFPSWVALARFSPDHRRLAVLTADQTYYILDTAGETGAAPAAKP